MMKNNFSMLVKTGIYLLLGINQIFLIFIISIGIFDLWFDFRKLNKKIHLS